MLEKYLTWEMNCDFCPDHLHTEETDFLAAVQRGREEGWAVYKDRKGDWTHKCPACRQEESVANDDDYEEL